MSPGDIPPVPSGLEVESIKTDRDYLCCPLSVRPLQLQQSFTRAVKLLVTTTNCLRPAPRGEGRLPPCRERSVQVSAVHLALGHLAISSVYYVTVN